MTYACPKCSSNVPAIGPTGPGTCPKCGTPLIRVDASSHAPGSDTEALAAEIQDAFSSGVQSLTAGPARSPTGSDTDATRSPDLWSADFVHAGARLGDFEVLDTIGHGGMGIVYRSRQVSLNRIVALKVLAAFARPGHSAVARFRQEAQAAARLHHTNIVAIYAQGEFEGHYYYAMELIDGVGLDVALRRGMIAATVAAGAADSGPPDPTPEPRSADTAGSPDTPSARGYADVRTVRRSRRDYRHLARLIAEVADALEYAHQHGVIHRDIKPQNLLLGRDNRLHVTDFGLAHLMNEPALTLSGETMGTPLYMSPEQVRLGHGQIDWRTDIHSLGVTLYEVLTLRCPFYGETHAQIMDQICTREPTAPRRIDPRVPVDLETICLRAMEKNRLRRYQSAGAMAEDLRRFADDRPILSRRTGRLVKAAKWVRRRKAVTATIVSLITVVALAAGLTAYAASVRHERANRHLQEAYEWLAYRSYRQPEPVAAKIDDAEARGADPLRVSLVRALAESAGPNLSSFTSAIRHADEVLAAQPDHIEALCIQAVALHLANRDDEAYENLRRVDSLGGPHTATEWFFYGLAIHFRDPAVAINSYDRAITLVSATNDMYPQAMVHLARAQNQLMYRTREIGQLQEAQNNLGQLIRAKLYDAYPYYLLSISYRLAAEIHEAQGTATSVRIQELYTSARDSALEGQRKDPADDRPITAEAECLESQGPVYFGEAIEARTRAIRVADAAGSRLAVWEGYHYRWRLSYWQDLLDDALADLEKLHEFDPACPFYARFYPALVYAEMGEMDRALATARALAGDTTTDASALLLEAACLRMIGQPTEADDLLARHAASVEFHAQGGDAQQATWLRRLYECSRGLRSVEDLVRSTDDLEVTRERRAQAWFHDALRKLSLGQRAEALESLTHAHRAYDSEKGYTYHAKLFCIKLQSAPAGAPSPPGMGSR